MKDGLCPAQHSTTVAHGNPCPLGVSPLYDPDPVNMYLNRDPRMYGTMLYPMGTFNSATYNSFPPCGSADAGDCSATSDAVDPGNFYNTHTGYLFLKYVDPADQNDASNSGINQILMRYADVLLMYAEAKAELGQFDAAVPADASINKLRDRVGMPHIAVGSQADMIKLIRNERAVELAGEGLRIADIPALADRYRSHAGPRVRHRLQAGRRHQDGVGRRQPAVHQPGVPVPGAAEREKPGSRTDAEPGLLGLASAPAPRERGRGGISAAPPRFTAWRGYSAQVRAGATRAWW